MPLRVSPATCGPGNSFWQRPFPHDSYMSDRTIDCHIRRIRGKLEELDDGFDGIETLYGLGYRLRGE